MFILPWLCFLVRSQKTLHHATQEGNGSNCGLWCILGNMTRKLPEPCKPLCLLLGSGQEGGGGRKQHLLIWLVLSDMLIA